MSKSVFILVIIFLASCKSKHVYGDSKSLLKGVKNDSILTAEKIIKNHYNNKTDFSTLYIRANAKYKDEQNSQSVSAEIKIKKGEKILVSVRFLGITMAKALITPKEVKYYEKIGGTYFEGNYEALSQWLGTDLNFIKIQNMLLGKPIDDLTKQTYFFIEAEKLLQLNALEDKTEKTFLFEANRFLLHKQKINQPEKERSFEADYSNFKELNAVFLPTGLTIKAIQKKGITNINIDYNQITFDEELAFPYSVPSGYERIFIK